MDPLSSSEAFIRALRGQQDDSSKIEIAERAWHSKTLYLPGRNSVIVDWLLQRLPEEKSNTTLDGPLLNVRFWTLLHVIITSEDAQTRGNWLPTLLIRRFYPSLLLSSLSEAKFLRLLSSNESLYDVNQICLSLVLPTLPDDTVQNFSWKTLDILARTDGWDRSGNNDIWLLIFETHRARLSHTRDRRKGSFAFTQSHLKNWLAIVSTSTTSSVALNQVVWQMGEDLLFKGNDLLVSLLSDRGEHSSSGLLPALSAWKEEQSGSQQAMLKQLTPILPSLLRSLHSAVEESSIDLNDLFGTSLSRSLRSRVALMVFLDRLLEGPLSLRFTNASLEADLRCLEACDSCLRFAEEENLLEATTDVSIAVLQKMSNMLLASLKIDTLRPLATSCLSVILRLDYAVLRLEIVDILSIISKDPSNLRTTELVEILIKYHAQTRTLDEYIHNVLDCFASSTSLSPNNTYSDVSAGALLSHKSRILLTQQLRAFVTPTQAAQLVKTFHEIFSFALKQLDPNKSDAQDQGQSSRTILLAAYEPRGPRSAVAFLGLLGRFIPMILRSVPLASIARDDISHVGALLRHWGDLATHEIEINAIRLASGKPEDSAVPTVLLSTLRTAACIMDVGRDFPFSEDLPIILPSGSIDRLSRALSEANTTFELQVEIANLLLGLASNDSNADHATGLLNRAVDSVFTQDLDRGDVSWDGQATHLKSASQTAIALLDLMLGRWLHITEHLAADDDIRRLAVVILDVLTQDSSTTTPPDDGFTARDIAINATISADFWEMKRLRVGLLDAILAKMEDSAMAATQELQRRRIDKAISLFRVMYPFPMDYFDRAARHKLVERAMSVDVYLFTISGEDAPSVLEGRIALRRFVLRAMPQDTLPKYPDYLYSCARTLLDDEASIASSCWGTYVDVTSSLLRLGHRRLAKGNSQSPSSLNDLLLGYVRLSAFSNDSAVAVRTAYVRSNVLHLIDVLVTDSAFDDVSDALGGTLHTIMSDVSQWLVPKIERIAGDQTLESPWAADVLEAYRVGLAYTRWSGDASMRRFNLAKVGVQPNSIRNLDTTNPSDIPSLVLAVLLEESKLHGFGEEMVATISGSTMLLLERCIETGKPIDRLADVLGRELRSWSLEHYEAVVELLREHLRSFRLGTKPPRTAQVIALFKLYDALLRNAPEGSGSAAHTLVHQLIMTLGCNTALASPGSSLSAGNCLQQIVESLQILEYISIEKSFLLRDIEVAYIFTFISRVLSTPPDDVRSQAVPESPPPSPIYRALTEILVALARNRPDLLASHFPVFTRTVCILLGALRSVPPRKGKGMNPPNDKFANALRKTLPWWASGGLGVEEAAALNRVFMNLSTKTTNADSWRKKGKKERSTSLATAFSKHAPFVLGSYIRTIMDTSQGATLSQPVRKALEEGLFELCRMVNEHERDMVYQMLGDDERGVFREFWKRYDKQRYTGTEV